MRGRPGRGLARAVVGTAVVAGTAGAVHHRQEQRWANKEQAAYQANATQQQLADQQAQIEQLQQQQSAPPPQQYAPPPQQYAPPPQQYAPPPQQYAPPPQQYAPPPPPTGGESATMQQLRELAQMRDAGILSEEEFAAAKQRILSGG